MKGRERERERIHFLTHLCIDEKCEKIKKKAGERETFCLS